MPIPDWFANRNSEFRDYDAFSRDPQHRVLLLPTTSSSGVSTFLKALSTPEPSDTIVVYCDLGTEELGDIADSLHDAARKRLTFRLGEFLRLRRSVLGFGMKVLAALTTHSDVPVQAGMAALGGIMGGILIPDVPSATVTRIREYVKTFPRYNVRFVLDNAQRKPLQALRLIQECVTDPECIRARFVVSYSDDKPQMPLSEFQMRIPSGEMRMGTFEAIGSSFVAALCLKRGITITEAECRDIAARCDGNIFALNSLLDSRSLGRSELSPLATFVLRLLVLSEQPLSLADLRLLSLRSELVFGDGEVQKEIDCLSRARLVDSRIGSSNETIALLATQSAPEVLEIHKQTGDNLVVANELYRFFARLMHDGSDRHARSAVVAMLYRLAKTVDPANVPALAQDLVNSAMRQGSLDDAARYIEDARPRRGELTVHDRYVQIAFFVSSQKFAEAKAVLDMIPRAEMMRYRGLRIIEAICLNRVRSHEQSDALLDELLENGSSVQEQALLASYKIAGLLHEEYFEEALAVFERWAARTGKARNHPYLLRNGAAVYMWGRTRDLDRATVVLEEAARVFTRRRDGFGVATTRCNLGVVHAYRQDFERAGWLFEKSFDSLSTIGTQHIQESGANLGTALLLQGRHAQARRHLEKLCALMEWDFPRVVAECDLVALDLLDGAPEAARRRAAAMKTQAFGIPIRDLKRRILAASAIASAVSGQDETAMSFVNDSAWSEHDEMREEVRAFVLSAERAQSEILRAFPFEYMQYWSQNPLKMLPAGALTPQAVLHDVA